MNTDQNIAPQRRGDAEGGTKEMAGEAIGHLVWDASASRLSLIGLRQPTTTPADYKGLFLTTAETGMNTDFFNAETRRRGEASLEEAGEVFVEGDWHLCTDGPRQSLFASEGFDGDSFFDIWRKPPVLPAVNNRPWSKLIDLFVVRQFFTINEIAIIFQEKTPTSRHSETHQVHAFGHEVTEGFGLLRIVGDAFDGFLHKRRFA